MPRKKSASAVSAAKKEDKANRKKGEAKQQAPAIGHNSDNALSDGEMQALFLKELGVLGRLNKELDRVKSEVRNQRKRMKSDGFEKYEVDYALELQRREEDEVLEERRREARVARWLAHPVGTQSDMFEEGHPKLRGNGTRADPQAQGRIAGAEGTPCKPPHNLAQDDAQRWITGWQEGQKDLMAAGIKAPTTQQVQ